MQQAEEANEYREEANHLCDNEDDPVLSSKRVCIVNWILVKELPGSRSVAVSKLRLCIGTFIGRDLLSFLFIWKSILFPLIQAHPLQSLSQLRKFQVVDIY